jgi:hypothetical protein
LCSAVVRDRDLMNVRRKKEKVKTKSVAVQAVQWSVVAV